MSDNILGIFDFQIKMLKFLLTRKGLYIIFFMIILVVSILTYVAIIENNFKNELIKVSQDEWHSVKVEIYEIDSYRLSDKELEMFKLALSKAKRGEWGHAAPIVNGLITIETIEYTYVCPFSVKELSPKDLYMTSGVTFECLISSIFSDFNFVRWIIPASVIFSFQ